MGPRTPALADLFLGRRERNTAEKLISGETQEKVYKNVLLAEKGKIAVIMLKVIGIWFMFLAALYCNV